MTPPAERKHRRQLIVCSILLGWTALIALGFFSRLQFGLEDDELEHLQMAWLIGQGDVPYRDFYQIHPPLWHFVVAPFLTHRTLFAQTPYIAMRAIHAGVIVLLLLATYRLLRKLLPAPAAAWGAGLFLIGSAYSVSWYDFRPDWIALLGLVLATGWLTGSPGRLRFAGAGMIVGVAALLTQKAWFASATMVLWMLATGIYATTREERRTRWQGILLFLCGAALVGFSLLAYFATKHAATELIHDIFITQLLHAPRERFFGGYVRASAPASAGLMCLTVIALIYLLRDWKQHLQTASLRGLLATLTIMSTIAYVLTPAPFEQSYLFLFCFWQCIVVADFLWSAVVELQRHAKWALAALALMLLPLALVQKDWTGRIVTAISWYGVLMVAIIAFLLPARHARLRPWIVLLVVSLVGLHFVVAQNLDTLRHEDRSVVQARVYNALDAYLAPNEPIISFWPPALPFRRHIGFSPLAHETILDLYGDRIQDDFIGAMQSGKVRVATGYYRSRFMNPPRAARWDAYVQAHCRPLSELPRMADEVDMFVKQD